MKKVFKHLILVYLLVFFVSVSNVVAVDSYECTYEKDLIVSFEKGGSVTIKENFSDSYGTYFEWFKNVTVTPLENKAAGLEHQLKDLWKTCPSSIYYCGTLERSISGLSLDLIKSLPENFKKENKDDFLKNLSNILVSYGLEHSSYIGESKSQLEDVYPFLKRNDESWNSINVDGKDYYIVSNEEDNFYKLINGDDVEPTLGVGVPVGLKLQHCEYLDYTGGLPTYNLACPTSTKYLTDYQTEIDNFGANDCKNSASCRAKTLNRLKLIEDKVKKFCSNILENYNYDGDVEQSCIEGCFDIAESMNTMKDNAGINKNNIGNCGFSARLLSWGRNIIKWVKYIIPVVLIVLGILDFIRAITKDKEEEMKKAQDRFVKRLIAAALIFIIPFILGFVLDKMGFGNYVKGCDVIDELNNYNGNEEDS